MLMLGTEELFKIKLRFWPPEYLADKSKVFLLLLVCFVLFS